MKKFKKNLLVTVTAFFVFAVLGITGPSAALAAGPPAVNLGTAGNFAILSQTGVTDANPAVTHITGNVGTYPISGAAIGLTCAEVTGTIYSRDAAGPLPCRIINPSLLNTAVNNMGTAYTNAAGRAPGTGPNLNVGTGTLSGLNFAPGTYTWNTPGNVTITGDITLTGSATDVWIFQISGTLNISSGKHIILGGSAQASNIFWQVAGTTTLGTNSTFEGNILDKTLIALQTGAILHGRALAQTAVTLDANTVSAPAGSIVPTPTPGSISGMKYNDANGNGHKNSGELGLQGWTINLTIVGSPTVVASTVTNASGNYSFSNLGPGTYKLAEVMQTGWKQTDHPDSVSVHSGTNSLHNDFGNQSQPIKVGPVAITGAEDIGTCNNVWALDSFNKFYSLTLNSNGTYNLQVNYKNGTFVTIAGISPGACEVTGPTPPGNGNTVAAGITGRMHQEFNIPLTATTLPNRNPNCVANNGCASANDFLNAVFGPGNYTRSPYSFEGHFESGRHGTWFDTNVNWPFNDRGDITTH